LANVFRFDQGRQRPRNPLRDRKGFSGSTHAAYGTLEALMRYRILLHKSDEGYSVSAPGLPGCWSQGNTEAEALGNMKDAIREYLTVGGHAIVSNPNPYAAPATASTPVRSRFRSAWAWHRVALAFILLIPTVHFAGVVSNGSPGDLVAGSFCFLSVSALAVFLAHRFVTLRALIGMFLLLPACVGTALASNLPHDDLYLFLMCVLSGYAICALVLIGSSLPTLDDSILERFRQQ